MVVNGLDVELPRGRITAVVGANGCGKSTLLRGLARLCKPDAGTVYLDGLDIAHMPTRVVAKRLGLLPQSPVAPEGMIVDDLVARGRFPHRRLMKPWSSEDARAVEWALVATDMIGLRDRPVDELSGGQRQRAWIAMALAQDTHTLLLDEPTTFLDVAHRMHLLDLLVTLNADRGRTIVMVLHDLNEAARYAHNLIAMHEGTVVASGPPWTVMTPEVIRKVFEIESSVIEDPVTGSPLCIPHPGASVCVFEPSS